MNIGAQMYTVRALCQTEAGFDESTRKVADIGYRYMQISGLGDFSAETIRDISAKHGVKTPLTHTGPEKMTGDLDGVMAFHKTIGADYVGIGAMPPQYARTEAGVLSFCADFKPITETLAESGFTFMYHNHSFEFERANGLTFMDIIAEKLPLAGFTLDTFWVAHGGGDPSAWLKKLAGRVDCVHFKDMKITGSQPYAGVQRMGEVGYGNLNWAAIFAAAESAGVKYAFVEQDDCYDDDPFDCLRKSYDFCNNLA